MTWLISKLIRWALASSKREPAMRFHSLHSGTMRKPGPLPALTGHKPPTGVN